MCNWNNRMYLFFNINICYSFLLCCRIFLKCCINWCCYLFILFNNWSIINCWK